MEFKEMLSKLVEFNEVYGIKYSKELVKHPNIKNHELRYELTREENKEFLEAIMNEDPVGVADAVGDMLYILLGTILDLGLQDKIEDVFNEIHRSNMSKLGEDGKPIYREDGKLLKGPNFTPPNLVQFIE